MQLVQESWKAVAATVVTALITFLTATGGGLSFGESARSAVLSVLSGLLIYFVPNAERSPKVGSGFIQGDNGQGVVGLILLVLGVICLLIGGVDLLFGLLDDRPYSLTRDIILIVIGAALIGARQYGFGDRGRSGTRL